MNTKIEKENLLLVEGRDEINFFEALLAYINIRNIQLIEVGGKDKFKDELPALFLSPNFSTVKKYGIVRDADDNADNTFQSIVDMLSRYSQPIPTAPGKIMSSNNITTGIFIMPGNSEEGMLEDLCISTLTNHPVLTCVDEYISCLHNKLEHKRKNISKDCDKYYFPKNEAKAKMHAFLSGMNKFVPSLGIAAKKGYFNFDSKFLDDVKVFLQNLVA
jgi:hypothetical protein